MSKKILKTNTIILPINKAIRLYSTNNKDASEIDKTQQPSKDENISNSSLQNDLTTGSYLETWNVRKLNIKHHHFVYDKDSSKKITIPKGIVHPDPDIHAKLHESSIDYESKDPNGVYPEIPDSQYKIHFKDLPVATMADRVDRVQKLLVRRAGTKALIKKRQQEKEAEEERIKAEEIKLKNIVDLAEPTEASSSFADTITIHEMTSDQKEVDIIGSDT